MTDKYVFIDRDGVINVDGENITEHGYITRWEDFNFVSGVLEAFRKFEEAGFKTVIISNQQCVARELLTGEELVDLTAKMVDTIKENGGGVAGVYYCPHHKDEDCGCRKPKSGLFHQAQADLGIEKFDDEYFIGDSERDVVAGRNIGLDTILVLSGKSSEEDASSWSEKPDHVCRDLLDAAEYIIREGG